MISFLLCGYEVPVFRRILSLVEQGIETCSSPPHRRFPPPPFGFALVAKQAKSKSKKGMGRVREGNVGNKHICHEIAWDFG